MTRRRGAVMRAAAVVAGGLGVISLLAPGAWAVPASAPSSLPAVGKFAVMAPPPGPTELNGVYCTTAANCWAVGQITSGAALLNHVLHWNGKVWRGVAVPSPGGTASNDLSQLYAVRCLTARDCWAVGQYQKGETYLAEALHWAGKKWTTTAVPAQGGTKAGDATSLFDSACISASNCWAAGDYGSGLNVPSKRLNLLLHWNGKTWSHEPVGDPEGTQPGDLNGVFSIRCPSASDCLAVGAYGAYGSTGLFLNETLRWNGRRWSFTRSPNPAGTQAGDDSQPFALACGSATSCWAAGEQGNLSSDTFLNELLHWNGKKWTNSPVPQPGGTGKGADGYLNGAVCSSVSNCWAVGEYVSSSSMAFLNESLHWNGKHWTLVATANPGGTAGGDANALYAVRCTSASNCWAVGNDSTANNPYVDEILHWNGKKWSAWPA
jgi:hypothetical protein